MLAQYAELAISPEERGGLGDRRVHAIPQTEQQSSCR
jgi:hypothetical protein